MSEWESACTTLPPEDLGGTEPTLPAWVTRATRRVPLTAQDKRWDAQLRTKYGLTLLQYERLLALQHGCCGVCLQFLPGKKRMYVDHDHKTGRVRGILCFRCNHRLLGKGLEDPILHEHAARYLRGTLDGRRL